MVMLIHIKHTQPEHLDPYTKFSGHNTRIHYTRDLIVDILSSKVELNVVDVWTMRPWEEHSPHDLKFRMRVLPLGGLLKALNLLGLGGHYVRGYPLMLRGDAKGLIGLLRSCKEEAVIVLDHVYSAMLIKDYVGELRRCGSKLIYISHDFEYDYFVSALKAPRLLAEHYFSKLLAVIRDVDLIVSVSLRDKLKYAEKCGCEGDRVVVYPNVYPPMTWLKERRAPDPSGVKDCIIAYVPIPGDDGTLSTTINEIQWALRKSGLGGKLIVMAPPVPIGKQKDLEVEFVGKVPERERYIKMLARAFIGYNGSRGATGTNVKRYDYALAGLYIINDAYGARGEPFPFEMSVVDKEDLAVKLSHIGSDTHKLMECGVENRRVALGYAINAYEGLSRALCKLLGFV